MNEQVDYVVPIEGHRSVYTDTIEALPLDQSTEVFGLHHNADISYYTNATKQIWRDMVDLQPRTGSTAGGITREEFTVSERLRKISRIVSRSPSIYLF